MAITPRYGRQLITVVTSSIKIRLFVNTLCMLVLVGVMWIGGTLSTNALHAGYTRSVLPIVHGEASQLRQLLQNLVGNALKFCKEAPMIRISAQPHGEQWWFTVRDNGIGIDPAHAERVFSIFQRLHTREEYEGTGIGLALCRKIVERHGGRIWVESRPGQGSAFHFMLPAQARAVESVA